MGNLFILILLAFSLGCGTLIRKPNKKPISAEEQLRQKSVRYSGLLDSDRDVNGFILTEECDSLLFSGLLGASLPGTVDVLAARDGNREWHRRPGFDCSPEIGNSRSTISRDMILGLFWHMWKNKQVDIASQLMRDLRGDNYWLKGQGTAGELLMTPAMVNTLAHLILKLGGPRYPVELALPVTFGKDIGYIAHLTIWHILLRGELLGEIPERFIDILNFHAHRDRLNPFYQAAYHKWLDGNMTNSVELLLNPLEWPTYTLPTTEEHCAEWVIQRDYTEKDWGPCSPQKHLTGAELIAIYNLIIR